MLTFLAGWFAISLVSGAVFCRCIHHSKILSGEILVC